MSHRLAQIESTMKQALAKVLQREISDPRIQGMVSITELKVSPDLHEAYVYVSVMPAEKQRVTLTGLRAAAGHIHRKLKGEVALRTVPRLDFRVDESLKKQADVFEAIREGLDRSGNDEADAEATPTASTPSDAEPGDAPEPPPPPATER